MTEVQIKIQVTHAEKELDDWLVSFATFSQEEWLAYNKSSVETRVQLLIAATALRLHNYSKCSRHRRSPPFREYTLIFEKSVQS